MHLAVARRATGGRACLLLGLALAGCAGGSEQGFEPQITPELATPSLAHTPASPATGANPPVAPNPGGEAAAPPASNPGAAPSAWDGAFVQRQGPALTVAGKPFRFIGVNHYQLAAGPLAGSCSESTNPAQYAAAVEQVAAQAEQMGATVIRFWAFQNIAGPTGHDFSALDLVVAAAHAHHLKLIPTLENEWKDCTQPAVEKSATWYDAAYQQLGGYPLSFPDYVRAIVGHLAHEPAIAMWQIANEAESSDPAGLRRYASTIAGLIKSVDHQHLVNLGTIGCGQAGVTGSDYAALYADPSIDVVEAHDYNSPNLPMPDCIAADIAVAKSLQKPFFIGEAGIDVRTGIQPAARASMFAAKLQAAAGQQIAGYLLWSFNPGPNVGSPGFDFSISDPLAAVVSRFSQAHGSAGFAP